MKPFPLSRLVAFAALLIAPSAWAVVTLTDEFDNNVVLTGASPNLVGAWAFQDGTAVESGGSITLTTGSGSYNEANLRTAVSPNLNFFTTAIRVEARGFSQLGTGDYANAENFRVGFLARTTSSSGLNFYGADDGVALRINNDATTFSIGYKFNLPSGGDPTTTTGMVASTGAINGTLAFAITGFDFTVSGTTWEAIFYGAAGQTSVNRGTWNIAANAALWGNATDGVGNSALNMYAQNAAASGSTGNSSFTLGSITVSTVPEPSRGLLLLGAGVGLLMRRRRI